MMTMALIRPSGLILPVPEPRLRAHPMSMLERSDIQLLPESLLRHADLSARNDKASPGATWALHKKENATGSTKLTDSVINK